ncbi:haloacid dehalogenase [Streptococcus equi subsp. zooepidemicus Sz35]|uniref:HAD family hydrolase n=1 Tax=Streptococcus equi TaxID=1336 RepID=UPI000499C128|nr:HAD family hydrolase [Streptococcus equi]AIA68754.1 haloacid dehalogenase [Streptococcus equi subsp. zooepidemicus CY]KIS20622.1 haloacid dehalogenase [Streptococcus equi subsp. zooepidemicus Sz35]MDI5989644.1 HAD family hydrolase [Streptococcus equi subsp. zooepidemicus]
MTKWLFFDVGSTLIDESLAFKAFMGKWRVSLARYGRVLTEEELLSIINELVTSGVCDFNRLWQRLAPKGCQRPKWSHQLERLFADTKPCLQVLSKTYQLGIIANQAKDLKERLERFGLSHYFALIVSSSDVGLQKPDLALFRYALDQAGVLARDAVYIGDRVDNDIIPAKTLGMTAIRIHQGLAASSPDDRLYPSDVHISKLSDLLEYF